MRRFVPASLFLLFVLSAGNAVAATYEIDPDHSSVNFAIKHLVVSKVRGKFQKFSGTFDFESGKPDSWKANATIQAASIDTNVKKRDDHLRSPDFLDAKKYPTIVFKSTRITDADDESAKMEGNLTMHGVTKPVLLDLEIGGAATDPWGNKKAGFSAKGKINRKDFGLTWNKTLESGGLLVGDEIEITLDVQGTEKTKSVAKQ